MSVSTSIEFKNHFFPQEHLCLGRDGYYHHRRDYYLAEEIGVGRFGKVLIGQDIRSQNIFAMKCNFLVDKTESIKRECEMLQHIGSHKNITQFFGAVMDEEFVYTIRAAKPQRVLKMFMEPASECVAFPCAVGMHVHHVCDRFHTYTMYL